MPKHVLLHSGAGSARSIRANPSPPPTSTSAAEDPSNPSLCVIVRTYWGHGGKEEDRGLRALLRSLQAQPLTRCRGHSSLANTARFVTDLANEYVYV